MSTQEQSGKSEKVLPYWFLAPYEEKEVRRRCHEQANEKCAQQFLNFGRCSEKHQLLFSWKCAEEKQAMFDCVALWGSREKYEELVDKYLEEKKQALKEEGKL